MNFKQALSALEARQESRVELGLDRVREHLRLLGRPQEGLTFIHVAGTNGKGSVCAILDSVLRAQGYRTGLYTSPHLRSPRERIRVDGRDIAEADFAAAMERALAADEGKRLTYFELMTAAALLHFKSRRVSVVVWETGLGGRLDATNVVTPAASVITSIGFDHTRALGRTLSAIAGEKAGIIKESVPVLCAVLPAAAARVVRARARLLGAPLTVARGAWKSVGTDWPRNRQWLSDGGGKRYALGILGSAQPGNVALAQAVLEALRADLPVSAAAWRRGLAAARIPGRCEVRSLGDRTLVLDGAHNPQAMAALASTLPGSARPARLILGLLKDKDARAILRELGPWLADTTVVTPKSPRALPAALLARELRRAAPRAHAVVEPDLGRALRAWLGEPGAPRTALVCGSFTLVGEAERVLGRVCAARGAEAVAA